MVPHRPAAITGVAHSSVKKPTAPLRPVVKPQAVAAKRPLPPKRKPAVVPHRVMAPLHKLPPRRRVPGPAVQPARRAWVQPKRQPRQYGSYSYHHYGSSYRHYGNGYHYYGYSHNYSHNNYGHSGTRWHMRTDASGRRYKAYD